MKQWIKKQKYKIAIALCSLLSIFTLFLGISNIYAYETDTFSYTLNKNTILELNNPNYVYDYTLNNDSGIYYIGNNRNFYFTNSNDTLLNGYVLLINFYVLDSNNNINNSINTQFNLYLYNANYNTLNSGKVMPSNKNSNGLYSCAFNIGAYSYNINACLIQCNYAMFIKNIDFVLSSQIGLSQYYDTYYGQIEDNYNNLLSQYNTLQDNYDTLENNYNTLESNYNTLENDYNTLLSQKNALEEEIITKQNQINTLTNELNRLNSEYNNIINVSAPFNPNNIGVATVLFNNTLLDIPYDSFIIFDYFQIELDLFDFDLIDNYNANSNHLIITLNLLVPKDFGTLKYWCNMRDSVGDYLSIYYYSDSTLLYSLEYMNNEHTDTSGNMAPYYLDSANNVNRVVFDFFLNDDYSFNNPYSNNTDYLIQYGTYTQGYNDGLNAANEYNDIIINNYRNEIQSYNVMVDNLNEEVHNLKQQINIKDGQIKSYQQARNDYNLNNMIWTIASTPFESFKQIWNVEFFGVNISTMITGFITGIVVLWIIKKFFL